MSNTGQITLADLKHIELSADEMDRYTVRRCDLLFNCTNSPELVGKMALRDRDEPFAVAGYLVRVRLLPERGAPMFVAKWFNTPEMKAQLRNRAKPSLNLSNISASELLKFPIPLPPLAEQRRIAASLDHAEALRAKRRHALAQLDTLTQSLFLDLFGDSKANQRRWPEVAMTMLFVASPVFGTMIPPVAGGGEWLSLRVANIQGGQLDLSDEKHVSLLPNTVARHSVRDGDLLMARAIASQEHLGKSVVVYLRDRKWAFDFHLMRLRFNLAKAEPEFIRHLLMTAGGRQLFLKAARRSAVQYNINTKEISALRIPIPPLLLQREFAAQVSAVERLKASQRASLAKLDALLASPKHRAFRGEL